MPHFKQGTNLRYLTFDLLEREQVPHGVITRQGGVSPAPWYSLNFGGTVGDDPQRVRKNHEIAFDQLGFQRSDIFDVWQVHGVDVVVAEKPHSPHVLHQKADIILTKSPDVVLFMRFADCVPILLYDPIQLVVGIAHAGWQGTVKLAAASAVQEMVDRFQSKPADLIAAIGPAIGPDHYEIGSDVAQRVLMAFADDHEDLLISQNGSLYLDLWEANRRLLIHSGVNQIEQAQICTACDPDDWYSHRRDQGKTGRFGVFIRLPA
jgi:YfiH family protein